MRFPVACSSAALQIEAMLGRLTRARASTTGARGARTTGDDGSLSVVISCEGFGFVGFGACTNP